MMGMEKTGKMDSVYYRSPGEKHVSLLFGLIRNLG